MELTIDNTTLQLKNIDKIYFETKNYTKADVINYYIKIAPYLLPHLKNRPFSMIHFPEGKLENSFYQKQCPINAPEWLETIRIPSKKRGFIDWCAVNNLPSLIYLVNRSVLEMHAWFSRGSSLDKPDLAVMDLDPSGTSGFKQAVTIANAFRAALEELNIYSLPKTSGSRGIHIFIPIIPQYTYGEVQEFLQFLCKAVQKTYPELCTTERFVKNRGDRIYLDAVQCASGKTLAMPYSMRVKSGALVSTPLEWSEVNQKLNPADYDIQTIFPRLEKKGDLSGMLYKNRQKLPLLQ